VNLVAPCNACYMGLLKAKNYLEAEQSLRNKVMEKLQSVGMKYEGRVNILHPLDVLVNKYGLEGIKKAVVKSLKDLNVVSYYGCQVVRPITAFDDASDPITMDEIVMTLGATAVDWGMKVRCCGGSMTSTISDVGLRLNYLLLKEAKRKQADIIVTACPLCQFNLECFQGKVSRMYKDKINIPVMFFTQLMGLAFGMDKKSLGINRLFVQPQHV
jgi:heterodisulfide reductase subunit B2